jgi:hypothetical protein
MALIDLAVSLHKTSSVQLQVQHTILFAMMQEWPTESCDVCLALLNSTDHHKDYVFRTHILGGPNFSMLGASGPTCKVRQSDNRDHAQTHQDVKQISHVHDCCEHFCSEPLGLSQWCALAILKLRTLLVIEHCQ